MKDGVGKKSWAVFTNDLHWALIKSDRLRKERRLRTMDATEGKDKTKVLIVEDEEAIRTGLVDVFVYHGYEVEAIGEGKEGLKKGLSGRYHLIILDVMLPGL